MKNKITLKLQKPSEAERFFEILDNSHFVYFDTRPSSVEAERLFLKDTKAKQKQNFAHNYSIYCDNKLVGGCGIKINQHRKFIGEIGYFIDEAYWGKGIATKAVKLLEKIGFDKLKLERIEVIMQPENKASERVAIKCGYVKEGKLRKVVGKDKKRKDALIYAKVR